MTIPPYPTDSEDWGTFDYLGVTYHLRDVARVEWVDARGKQRSSEDEGKSYVNFGKARLYIVVFNNGNKLEIKRTSLESTTQLMLEEYVFPG